MAISTTTEKQTYILKADKELPAEKQTEFYFQPLTALDMMQLEDKTHYSDTETVKFPVKVGEEIVEREVPLVSNSHEMIYNKVLKSLCGWKNLTDASGAQVPFSETDRPSNLNHIRKYLFELSVEVDRINVLTETQAGN